MNSRQLFLALITMGLFAHSSVLPMSTALGYARAGFSKACTGAHWTIFAAPFLAMQYKFFTANIGHAKDLKIKLKNEEKPIEPVAKDIKKLIHTWDHNNSLKNVSLYISKSDRPRAFFSSTYYPYNDPLARQAQIEIDPDFVNLVSERKEALQKNELNQVKKIDAELLKYKHVIQHELGHIRNNDSLKTGATSLMMPIATLFCLSIARKLLQPKPSNPTLLKDIMKIPSACGKVLLTVGGIFAIDKHQEMLADKNIESNITTLQHAKAFFEMSSRYTPPKKMQRHPWLCTAVEELENINHPGPSRRIWAIDKRIERLKRKQEQEK